MKRIFFFTLLIIVHLISLAQENEPTNTLSSYGITFPSGDYDIPTYSDYATVIYIDPDTLFQDATHWNTLSGKTLTGNTAYLFKRNTHLNEGGIIREFFNDNIYLGAYGTGNRPLITLYRFDIECNDVVLDGIHVYNTTTNLGVSTAELSNYIINDCDFERAQGATVSARGGIVCWATDVKFLNSVVHGQLEDGLYFNGQSPNEQSVELAYCYVTDVNRYWFTDEKTPGGDCAQFSGTDTVHSHHNVLDRFGTGNKFVMISRDAYGYMGGSPIQLLFEYNVLIMNSETQWPFGGSYGGAGVYFEENHNATVRYNDFIGNDIIGFMYEINTSPGSIDFYGNNCSNAPLPFRVSNPNVKIYNNTFYNTSQTPTGNPSASLVKNNLFETNYSNLFDTTNGFVDELGGWNLIVEDAANLDFLTLVGSPTRNRATWDGVFDTDFNEDKNGTSITQATWQFDKGAEQYTTDEPGACDLVNITQSGVVVNEQNGGGDGSITVTVGGNGATPYSYLWSNGATTQNISGLSAGQYSLVITDYNGCTSSKSYLIQNEITVNKLTIEKVWATDYQDPNVAANMIDDDYENRWSSDVYGVIAYFTLADTSNLDSISTAVLNDDTRQSFFAVQTSMDSLVWGSVVNCTTQTGGSLVEYFVINQPAKYFRIIGYGNSDNLWNSFLEVQAIGMTYIEPSPSNKGDSIQVNLGSDDELGWYDINSGNTSVTDGKFTVYYSGESASTGGIANGVYPNDVAISNVIEEGAGAVIDIVCKGFETDSVLVEFYGSTTQGTLRQIQYSINGVIKESAYNLYNNSDIVIDTVPTVGDSVYVEVLETNSVNRTFANGFRFIEYSYISPCDTITIIPTGIVTDVNCAFGSDGGVALSVSGGAEPYSYNWSNGAATQNLTNVEAATYSVTIVDGNGCDTTKSYTITQPNALYIQSTNFPLSCFDGNDRSVKLQGFGGTPPYKYFWSTLNIFADQIDTLRRFSYPGIMIDDNECTLNFNVSATVFPDPFYFSGDITNDTNYNKVGVIQSYVNGGTGSYKYLWPNGDTTSFYDKAIGGENKLIITDDNDCEGSYIYQVPNINVYNPGGSVKTINSKTFLLPNGKTFVYRERKF